jgi:hypothetical protein
MASTRSIPKMPARNAKYEVQGFIGMIAQRYIARANALAAGDYEFKVYRELLQNMGIEKVVLQINFERVQKAEPK